MYEPSSVVRLETFPGITNYVVPVPGSAVTVYLAVRDWKPESWVYALWSDDDELVASSELDLTGLEVDADLVARIAFLLEVDYAQV